MNKLTIPAILVATVMVAGIFAFMPIEQASTVHTTIQGTQYGGQVIIVFSTSLTADSLIATSDADFTVCVVADNPTGGNADVTVTDGASTLNFLIAAGDSADVGCYGGNAGATITIASAAAIDAFATLTTTSDATAGIT